MSIHKAITLCFNTWSLVVSDNILYTNWENSLENSNQFHNKILCHRVGTVTI